MSFASSAGLGIWRLTTGGPFEECVAGELDVLARESGGALRVAGDDGVEDALVLVGHVGRAEELLGMHLSDAQLDLAQQEVVHAREALVVCWRTGLAVLGAGYS